MKNLKFPQSLSLHISNQFLEEMILKPKEIIKYVEIYFFLVTITEKISNLNTR